MFELAGGKDAPLVVIPTANGAGRLSGRLVRAEDVQGLRRDEHHALLHTKDRKVADSEAFVRADHRRPGIVWFVGGRQWRLVDAYLHTRTQREVEKRARARRRRRRIVGRRVDPRRPTWSAARVENNFIMMAPGYEEGFGLIKGVAIDQHMLTRNRQDDLEEVVAKHPGACSASASTRARRSSSSGQQFEVIGASKVAIHDGRIVQGRAGAQRRKKSSSSWAPARATT